MTRDTRGGSQATPQRERREESWSHERHRSLAPQYVSEPNDDSTTDAADDSASESTNANESHVTRPLHIRLMTAQPDREVVEELLTPLREAGHVITTTAGERVPEEASASPDFVIVDGSGPGTPESLEAAEARHIAAVLAHAKGNRRQAALALGIARSTLLAKIRRYGL